MKLPESLHVYRYWVELRDWRDGSVRELPLQAFKLIHLSARKGGPQLLDEVEPRVQDGGEVLKARDIDGIATQLRRKYPDETHERFLRSERGREGIDKLTTSGE